MKLDDLKKITKIGACVVAGIVAFATAIADQKKDDKLEEMEKRLSKLEGKES